jgi:hypothetical protein
MGERIVRHALCLLVLAGTLAACGGGGGDDDASEGGDAEATTTTDAPAGPSATGTTLGGNGEVERSEEAQSYVDALTTASASGGVSESEDQNRCFAEAYVDTVGVDALVAAMPAEDLAANPGLTPDSLGIAMTPEQESTFYTGLQRCIDTKGFFVGIVTSGASLSPDQSSCLAANLNDDSLELILVAPFDGDPAPIENDQGFQAIIDGLISACPDAMAAAGWS